ncbi:MAG: hypothetical protein U0165_12190 [Polyangiaceae bacterium]
MATAVDEKKAAFEKRIEAEARRFELKPLLDLLSRYGYRREDIIFESAPGSTSPSIIDAVRFERQQGVIVYITLNIGLLGDSSLLPSYFFEVAERTRDPDTFYDFIRFFDHRLLQTLVRSLHPEDDDVMFRDWGAAKTSFLKMLGMGSTSTLQWLMQLYFPELRVQAFRQTFSNLTTSHAFRPGSSPLDGTGVLGKYYAAAESGLIVDLVAEEEIDARGNAWAAVVRKRLDARVIPVLKPYRIPLVVRLKVLVHASWLQVEGASSNKGFLGYDRFKTEEESGHTIIVYRHGSAGADEG